MFKRNTWVRIHKIVLRPEERATNIPEETKKVPLEMWVKGYLLDNANMGDEVDIRTVTGRVERGRLIEVYPAYEHSYGQFIEELLEIDEQVKDLVFGEDDDE